MITCAVLPPQTGIILEMLSVLNLRMPLAQLGQAAQVDSPERGDRAGGGLRPGGLVARRTDLPGGIRHPLVRDAIYAGITAARRRLLHARAASVVSEAASWEHRVAALDRPDEAWPPSWNGWRAGRWPTAALALAATHLQWASDISPARADRERRLLTAALHLTGPTSPRRGPAPGGGGGGAVPAAQLRAWHDGVLPGPARRGGAAI